VTAKPGHAVDPDYFMLDMVEDGPPPIGADVRVLTAGGKAIDITWTSKAQESGDYYAWSRHPKVKAVTKQRMLKQYGGKE